MRFLAKDKASSILNEGMTYQKDRSPNNRQLLEALLLEQRGFCAYTERYMRWSDSPEVEHFNPALKYEDDYFNYYAVLRNANQRKTKRERRSEFEGVPFFGSRFFQDPDELNRRIRYIREDHMYETTDPDDREAEMLIEYLGINDWGLVKERRNHSERVFETCRENHWSNDAIHAYFIKRPEELSFITALELGLDLDLSSAIPPVPLVLDNER